MNISFDWDFVIRMLSNFRNFDLGKIKVFV